MPYQRPSQQPPLETPDDRNGRAELFPNHPIAHRGGAAARLLAVQVIGFDFSLELRPKELLKIASKP